MSSSLKIISNSTKHSGYLSCSSFRSDPDAPALAERGIRNGGIAVIRAPYEMRRAGGSENRHVTLWLILEGTVRFEVPGRRFTAPPGSTLVMNSDVDRLCRGLGRPLDGEGRFFAFPTAGRLAALEEADLAFLRAGWRSGYILDAARRAAAGQLDEAALRAMPLAQARAALMEVRGVGPKVADCTLLYGLGRWDAYPVDVWMRRAGQALFTARVKDPAAYLNRRTGGCAGIAQQYIFAWARSTGLTEKTHKNPACD